MYNTHRRTSSSKPSCNKDEGEDAESQIDGSQFSESNPLAAADPPFFKTTGPTKPQAVALHGWHKTVGVDDDFDPTPSTLTLGAPGTGLLDKVKPTSHLLGTAAHGPSLSQATSRETAAAVLGPNAAACPEESWGALKITREDKREAKSLRAVPPAPGAAPLPFPRVLSETDASSVTESIDSLAKRQRERRFETQSSGASSDLSFLVNTASNGSLFGTRATFGRCVEPRVPATVGEGRLHNSLAKYFGQNRGDVQRGDSVGESRTCSVNDDHICKERSSGRATVSSTPATTKLDTRESSLDGSQSRSVGANTHIADLRVPLPKVSNRRDSESSGHYLGGSGARRAPAAMKATKRLSSADSTERSVEDQSEQEAGGKGDDRSGLRESERVEPGQRVSRCGCFRGWPWKVRDDLTAQLLPVNPSRSLRSITRAIWRVLHHVRMNALSCAIISSFKCMCGFNRNLPANGPRFVSSPLRSVSL